MCRCRRRRSKSLLDGSRRTLNPFFIIERFRETGGMPSHRISDFRRAGASLAPNRHADNA
jgi:hypothetical protein